MSILNHDSFSVHPGSHLCLSTVGSVVSQNDGGASLPLGPFTVTKLMASVDYNTSSVNIDLVLEKDEVSVLTLTIPAGQTGIFEVTGNIQYNGTEQICTDVTMPAEATGFVNFNHIITFTQ